jgi:hypothetical protein
LGDNGKVIIEFGLKEFLENKFKPREMLLDPWLCKPSFSIIHAQQGFGKTYFILGIIIALAYGTKFLKFKAKRKVSVCYFDGEMAGEELQRRIKQMLKALKCSDEDLETASQALKIVPFESQPRTPNISDRAWHDAIIEKIGDAEVVVFDNLSCLSRGMDENDAKGFQAAQDLISKLKAMGKAVILIAHQGKKPGEQRGTTKKLDQVDQELSLEPPPGHERTSGVSFVLRYLKSRLRLKPEDAAPFMATFMEGDDFPNPYWHVERAPEVPEDEVTKLLRQGVTAKKAAEMTGVHERTAQRRQKDLNLQKAQEVLARTNGHAEGSEQLE